MIEKDEHRIFISLLSYGTITHLPRLEASIYVCVCVSVSVAEPFSFCLHYTPSHPRISLHPRTLHHRTTELQSAPF